MLVTSLLLEARSQISQPGESNTKARPGPPAPAALSLHGWLKLTFPSQPASSFPAQGRHTPGLLSI